MTEANSGAGRVTRETRDGVFLIGLDRAGKRNAFDTAMLADLSLALGEFERDPALRCAVLFAHGENFTAGLDLMEIAPKLSKGGFNYPEQGLDPFGRSKPRRTKPLVLAVRGICWTAGIELALAADIVVAASDTRFAQLEVLRGIAPAGGATVRLPATAGWSDAMRYMLTGDEFGAAEALRMRLVSEVVAPGAELTMAVSLAERIAKAAPLGVQATLASARKAQDEGHDAALATLNDMLLSLMRSEDVREGVAAMVQKRAPVFKGA